MFYSIRHVTRFRYSGPVRESVMELRMQPRSEGPQTLRSFQISTNPRAQLYAYTDHLAMRSITSNLLREHEELRIEAQATVELAAIAGMAGHARCPGMEPLQRLQSHRRSFRHAGASRFARFSPELESFMQIADLQKPVGDPFTALRTLQRGIYDSFEYESGVTEVNSPIDVALEQRRGVCQDFAHIMTAIARAWGIPCRYVSGYLYHKGSRDRSSANATHAGWKPICHPWAGWASIPQHIMAGERHVRAAVGRDYADVPPTRGTYKGGADSELSIAVSLEPTQAPVRHEDFLKVARRWPSPTPTASMPERLYHQQQQQQQQE